MDNTFAGKQPSGEDESKAAAARRILAAFVEERAHDEIGVVVFSTSPILALPLTLQREAIEAAIAAIGRPGLAYTNIGLGLAMALSLFDEGRKLAAALVRHRTQLRVPHGQRV